MRLLDWTVDQETLIVIGGTLQKLKMYPYFDMAHYLLKLLGCSVFDETQENVALFRLQTLIDDHLKMCNNVRQDLGYSSLTFSRRHPFSCWLSSMLMCFAGRILACFMLGEAIITPFRRHDDVILASVVWYSVFYSPLDLIHNLVCFKPVKVLVNIAAEIQRVHKISSGLLYATKLYPESYMVQLLVGVARGAGSGIVKIVEQLVRGSWLPSQHELLRPSFTTKACFLASLVFILERNSMYVAAPHDLVYLCVVGFFVYFKLSALLLDVVDPFAPIENFFCALFMGGVRDALFKFVAYLSL
ncbi:hypothetical protein DICVIV_13522 [Dictyocaulus viviparus]|uniref:Uncharacterized protein n=1 Tax=Dictyocaulus viviparus TaxID=29172 RepID=A0A0D8XDK0_DICVI|nr:hypothetical protein DICVIV_13522 [Dictyocaulus viviparus]